MNTKNMTMRRFGYLLVAALMSGCASTPTQNSRGAFDDLYDGKAKIAYATELPASSASEAVARGDKALREGDEDLALYRYVKALELDAKVPNVYRRIGFLHLERNRLMLAERAFRAGLAVDADDAALNEGLGLTLLRARHYKEARKALEAAVRHDIRRWRSHNALGVIADLTGDHLGAQRAYETALYAAPRAPQVLNNLGYSRYLTGDYAEAITHLEAAVQAQPRYERAWLNLGLVLARSGRYDEALAAFERVTDKPGAYNNVGYVSLQNQEPKRAERYLRQAIRLAPKYYDRAHSNLEAIARRTGSDF